MGHLANINSPNPFSKELSALISLAHRARTHSLSDIPVCLELCGDVTRRHCGTNSTYCWVYAVDHYSLLRYVPSFDFPMKRSRSQFSLFLSSNGGLVSKCNVTWNATEVGGMFTALALSEVKLVTFTWSPFLLTPNFFLKMSFSFICETTCFLPWFLGSSYEILKGRNWKPEIHSANVRIVE